ncbi:acyl-CoA carboxylase subunit beta [Streptomyces tanashiensis]
MAIAAGAPLVSLNDGAGARIQEGVSALAGYGGIFQRNTRASGVIPQISRDARPVRGRRGLQPGADGLRVHGPRDLADVHHGPGRGQGGHRRGDHPERPRRRGRARRDLRRRALRLRRRGDLPRGGPLPPVDAPAEQPREPAHRRPPRTRPTAAPTSSSTWCRPTATARTTCTRSSRSLSTTASYLEIHERWARNIICALARLDGQVVGIVANQPQSLAGVLDIEASEKAARFVQMCDAFNIPIITLLDVPGFLPASIRSTVASSGTARSCCTRTATRPCRGSRSSCARPTAALTS